MGRRPVAMAEGTEFDAAGFARLLRADRLVRDAEVFVDEDGVVTAVLAPQGPRPGPLLRQLVRELADRADEQLRVVVLPTVPRSADGAVDRARALESPDDIYLFERPATATEFMLVELVQQVLPGVQVSVTDSLPTLGADSLITIELTALIEEAFGTAMPPHEIFAADCLRDIAAALAPGAEAAGGHGARS